MHRQTSSSISPRGDHVRRRVSYVSSASASRFAPAAWRRRLQRRAPSRLLLELSRRCELHVVLRRSGVLPHSPNTILSARTISGGILHLPIPPSSWLLGLNGREKGEAMTSGAMRRCCVGLLTVFLLMGELSSASAQC